MSCICQDCGEGYKVDIIVPDDLWEKITPKGKAVGAGLLCGSCIAKFIEGFNKYEVYHLVESKDDITNEEKPNPLDSIDWNGVKEEAYSILDGNKDVLKSLKDHHK